MASTALHIFPQPANPQRHDLRPYTPNGKRLEQSQPPSSLLAAASCGFTGVSFQVHDYTELSPIVINKSANHAKYSMPQAALPRTLPATVSPRNMMIGSSRKPLSPVADNSPMTPVGREDLPPEPVSPHFSTPNRMPSHRMRGSSGSIRGEENMRSSPLSAMSSRSNSPTLVRRNSGATDRADTPQQAIPMKSIFPQLQPGIPLSQQIYRPVEAPATGLPRQLVSKGTEMSTSQALPQPPPLPSRRPLAITVPERQTQPVLAPIASRAESLEVWNLANGDASSSSLTTLHYDLKCRTIQNGQKSITRPGIEVDVVDAAGTKLYMTKLSESSAMHGSTESFKGDLNVQRCHPEEEGTFPVAQMDMKLPIEGFSCGEHDDGVSSVTSLFPQVAALSAIKSVADSLQARTIARFDPNATSPQAAQLAFDAVQCAKEAEEATLVFRTPTQISSSSPGTYELQHPTMGPLSISVQGRNNLFAARPVGFRRQESPQRGSITIRGPSVRPGCTVDLASLDLNTERLTLNIEALGTLESQYMIDTAVCTLVAVAISESFRPENGGYHTYFAAPSVAPRRPAHDPQRCPSVASDNPSCRSTRRMGLFKRPGKADVAVAGPRDSDADGVKLPPVIKVALKLLGFSFEAIIWVLSLGVKVLVKLVSCMAGGTSKA